MQPFWLHNGVIMPSLTIKNLPPDLYLRLKESAARNRRSLTNEVIVAMERQFPKRRTPEEERRLMEEIREMRERISKGRVWTEEEITAWKREGRP